jgi:hypothetical protein
LFEIEKKAERIGISGSVFTLGTANSACSVVFYARISGIQPNPLKYTHPDGKTQKSTLEIQIESTVKVIVFLYQNKDSIKKAGEGAAKIAVGLGVASLGVGGGAGITIGSGGTAALGGVALADAAIVTGGTLVGAGATDILNSIVMMSQGQSIRSNQSANDAKKIDSNSQANKFAQSKGYKNAEDLKEAYISGQKDTTAAHYNIYENKKTGESFVIHNEMAKNIIIKILE